MALVGGVTRLRVGRPLPAAEPVLDSVPYWLSGDRLAWSWGSSSGRLSAASWARPSPVWGGGSTGPALVTASGLIFTSLRASHRPGHRRARRPGHQGPSGGGPVPAAAALRRERLSVRLPGLQAAHRHRPGARLQRPAAAAGSEAVHPAQAARHVGDHRRPDRRRRGDGFHGGRPVIPSFVLEELQSIADSAEPRRAGARAARSGHGAPSAGG